MHKKIISLLIAGVGIFAITTAFAVENYNSLKSNAGAVSSTSVPVNVNPQILTPSSVNANATDAVLQTKKCGVNTYSISNECGIGAFKNMYFQCYDGYEQKEGGESSCKSSEVWARYAREACANRCSITTAPTAISEKPLPKSTPTIIATEVRPVAICYIPDKLTKDYNQLIIDMRKAELEGDKVMAEEIMKKITALKTEIERSRKECLVNALQPNAIQPPTVITRSIEPTAIDRCRDVAQWENKIAYYQKLADLSDAELKEQTGFTKAEIEKILANLPNGLVKVKAQCQVQTTTTVQSITASQAVSVAEPVKPVAVESGREINDYYKARIEKISSEDTAVEQIQKLQSLKSEIDGLVAQLIKGRKEIEVSELNNVVSEIKVSKGEIKADEMIVETTDKKMFLEIGGRPVSVEPTATRVLIRDGNLEVTADEVFIKDNALNIGNAPVKLAASEVAENLNISPIAVELKEENSKAVYKLKVSENRKLFWFIPIKITKILTADAENSNLLSENLPWYSFLTKKY